MAQCERLEGCPFFKKIKDLPKTTEQLVSIYCRGNTRGCARLWVLSAGVRVPDDLFPNEKDRALRILSDAGKSPRTVLQTIKHRKQVE